jgi:hypothetical protein
MGQRITRQQIEALPPDQARAAIDSMSPEEFQVFSNPEPEQTPEDAIKQKIDSMSPEEFQTFSATDPDARLSVLGIEVEKPGVDFVDAAKGLGKFALGVVAPGVALGSEQGREGVVQGFLGGQRAVESVAAAPFRSAVGAAQQGEDPIAAFGGQFGKAPELAPTGKDIAVEAGLSPDNIQTPLGELPFSTAGVAGVGIELGTDITSFFGLGTGQALKTGGKRIAKAFPLKENAEEIIAAAKKLGVTPTPAQLYDSQLVGKLEGALLKRHGKLGGMKLRKTVDENFKVIQKEAESIIGEVSGKSVDEIGSAAKGQIRDVVSQKIKNASDLYDRFESAYSKAPADIQPIRNALEELSKKYAGTPAMGKINNWKNSIDQVITKKAVKNPKILNASGKEIQTKATKTVTRKSKIKTIDNLKEFRTAAGKLGKSLDPVERDISQTLRRAATDARSDSLVRAAEFAEDLPPGVAEELIKAADKTYAEAAGLVKTLLPRGKEVKGGVKFVLDKTLDVSDESMVANILKSGDAEKMADLKKVFPEAFETLRLGKIDEVISRSIREGEISPKALTNIINKMPKATAELLLGPGAKPKAAAIRSFLDGMAKNANPSDSGTLLEFFKMFNVLSQAGSIAQSRALQLITSGSKLQSAGSAAQSFALPASAVQQFGREANRNQSFRLPGE